MSGQNVSHLNGYNIKDKTARKDAKEALDNARLAKNAAEEARLLVLQMEPEVESAKMTAAQAATAAKTAYNTANAALPKTGGKMKGNVDVGGHALTNAANLGGDVVILENKTGGGDVTIEAYTTPGVVSLKHWKKPTPGDTIIRGVAPGVNDMDAVNVAQLKTALNSGTSVSRERVEYNAYPGNQLLISGGTKASEETRVTSDLIPVTPGDVYFITCSANWGNALFVVYNADQEVCAYEQAEDTEDGTVYTDKEVTMQAGAAYIRIGCNLGIQPDGHSVYKRTVNLAGKWAGKKWVAVGDSLTEENIRTSKNYLHYIAESTGINVVNFGVGGTGYANGNTDVQAFYQRMTDIPADADVVTIFGSFNDLSENLPVGTPLDTAGTETYSGYFAAAVAAAYARNPAVALGIITPTPWEHNTPLNDDTGTTEYVAALVEFCRVNGIPCLDLFHCSGLRPWDASFRAAAYSKDDGNGTHPDETGHAMIAPKIKAFLETLIM